MQGDEGGMGKDEGSEVVEVEERKGGRRGHGGRLALTFATSPGAQGTRSDIDMDVVRVESYPSQPEIATGTERSNEGGKRGG